MSDPVTPRLALPLLSAAQAQKEVAHNEALMLIDLAAQPVVVAVGVATPPATPAVGQCWIVGTGASGAWSGHDKALVLWSEGGWRFATPGAGWRAYALDRGHGVTFDGSAWTDDPVRPAGLYVAGQKVVGSRQAAIALPSGGTVVDSQARAAIGALVAALQAHGLTA